MSASEVLGKAYIPTWDPIKVVVVCVRDFTDDEEDKTVTESYFISTMSK